MTTHAQLDQIAHVTARASELSGAALERYVFVCWWRYPFARRALADVLHMPRFVLAWVCERRLV